MEKNEAFYTTPEARINGFELYCKSMESCIRCPIFSKVGHNTLKMKCLAHWLSMEVNVEVPNNCPFCTGSTSVKEEPTGYRICCNRSNCYSGPICDTREDAIRGHNRIVEMIWAKKEK